MDADLGGTTVEGAIFTNADLTRANLEGICDLEQALWTGAVLDEKWSRIIQLLREPSSMPADLSGWDFSGACLKDVDLSRVDLSGADFSRAQLFGVSLDDANLDRVDIAQAELVRTTLKGATLYDADFQAAALTYVDLTNAEPIALRLETQRLTCTRLPDQTFVQGALEDCR